MSQLGIGVMLGLLGGNNRSVEAFQENVGKVIEALDIDEERLLFKFADGKKMKLFDNGQSCCEHRYMHTDDNIQDFVGAILQSAEVREGPEEKGEWGEPKESAFLIISTSSGQFTVVNYNEHNGYYGGFLIEASTVI